MPRSCSTTAPPTSPNLSSPLQISPWFSRPSRTPPIFSPSSASRTPPPASSPTAIVPTLAPGVALSALVPDHRTSRTRSPPLEAPDSSRPPVPAASSTFLGCSPRSSPRVPARARRRDTSRRARARHPLAPRRRRHRHHRSRPARPRRPPFDDDVSTSSFVRRSSVARRATRTRARDDRGRRRGRARSRSRVARAVATANATATAR